MEKNLPNTVDSGNALSIVSQFPEEKYNLLVPMTTVAEIAEIHRPVMNVVQISTNLNDKEIYEQEKAKNAWTDGRGEHHPATVAGYALTKKGLNKLMRAAGIKILGTRPIIPTACQKCAEINKGIGRPVNCGACPNQDVKFEARISVPQLTGENTEIVAHKEIIVKDAINGMKDRQIDEFLKFRNEICETKAINRALRAAMHIKGTYTLEELKKPFVVAYLVPNLDNELVKEEAVKHMFSSAHELYGSSGVDIARKTMYIENDTEDTEYEASIQPIEDRPNTAYLEEPKQAPREAQRRTQEAAEAAPDFDPTICVVCGAKCSGGVVRYSNEQFGRTLCMRCQREGQQ